MTLGGVAPWWNWMLKKAPLLIEAFFRLLKAKLEKVHLQANKAGYIYIYKYTIYIYTHYIDIYTLYIYIYENIYIYIYTYIYIYIYMYVCIFEIKSPAR